jgi:hypothetical protein
MIFISVPAHHRQRCDLTRTGTDLKDQTDIVVLAHPESLNTNAYSPEVIA